MKRKCLIPALLMFCLMLIFSNSVFASEVPLLKVMGYYNQDGDSDDFALRSIARFGSQLDAVSMASFSFDATGNLKGEPPSKVVSMAKTKDITTYAMIHNFVYPDGFDAQLVSDLLNNPQAKSTFIRQVHSMLKRYGFKGVNIDFEQIPAKDSVLFTELVKDLKQSLSRDGFMIIVSLPAKISDDGDSDWGGAYDFAALGKIADYVQLMTYDQHWLKTGAGPVASLNFVNNSLEYTMSKISPQKIMLGLATYGYDWGSSATQMRSQREISQMIIDKKLYPSWSDAWGSAYFMYVDEAEDRHEVWFENRQSLELKIDLAISKGLAGVAIWRLGYEEADFWKMINTKLNNPAIPQTLFSWGKENGWKNASGANTVLEADAVNKRLGESSLKATAADGEIWIDKEMKADLYQKQLYLEFFVHDVSKLKEIHILMGLGADWNSYFGYPLHQYSLKNGWNRIALFPKDFYKLGEKRPDAFKAKNISQWRIKIVSQPGQTASVSFDNLQISPLPKKGKVSITFDDGYSSVYYSAKKIMDAQGFAGVAYVITDLIDKPGRMTAQQLRELHDSGWDIASHSKTHQMSEREMSTDEFLQELVESKAVLESYGFKRGAQHYAAPGGRYTDQSIADIKRIYKTHRTILEEKEALPAADYHGLKIRNIINSTPLDLIKTWVDQAADNKEWLILLYHNLASPDDIETKVSPEKFKEIMDYLATKNLDVATISDLAP